MSESKLISIVYINVCVIWEYARNAIESTIIFMMNYFFTDCKKWYYCINAVQEYTTGIKPLRELCTHHLSYNFTFSVPFMITILNYLFLKILIECLDVNKLACVIYVKSIYFSAEMLESILTISIAISKWRIEFNIDL